MNEEGRADTGVADGLGERLRAQLAEQILDGRLAPGTELDERGLGERFGMSRTPVRQALAQLAAVGLVELRPRQPAVVAVLDPYRMAEMFEVLAGLEAIAAQLAARRITETQLAELQAHHARAGQALDAGDGGAYLGLNLTFHRLVYQGSHNDYLADQAWTLRMRLAPYRGWLFQKTNRMRRSHSEHQALLDALQAGNEERAFQIMREHVQGGDHFADMLILGRHRAPTSG